MQLVLSGSMSVGSFASACADITKKVGGEPVDFNAPFYGGPSSLTDSNLFPSLIVDAICLFDVQFHNHSQKHELLVRILKEVTTYKFIPLQFLTDRIQLDTLEKVAILSQKDYTLLTRSVPKRKAQLFYKMTTFNLLREESEGYAKVAVIVTKHLTPPLHAYYHTFKQNMGKCPNLLDIKQKREADMDTASNTALQNLKTLIGYFDLNTDRVLDLVMDIFAASVRDYWEFFVKLLLKSPWAPNSSSQNTSNILNLSQRTAQIMGFKMSQYNKDANISKPVSNQKPLMWITAILIKHGLLDLDHLYPHLGPDDNFIEQEELTLYLAELRVKSKQAGKFTSGPGLSGVLIDDSKKVKSTPLANMDVIATIGEKTKVETQPVIVNQKAGIAASLLAIGDHSHARKILDRLPVLCQMNPEIADNFMRIIGVMLEKLEISLRPFGCIPVSFDFENYPPPFNSLNPKICREPGELLSGRYKCPAVFKFFYDDWRTSLTFVKDCREAMSLLKNLLPYVGPHLYRDVKLLTVILRVGNSHSSAGFSKKHETTWLDIIARYILPAVSQIPPNPMVSRELWTLISHWPYTTRYALYGEWKNFTYKDIPELQVALSGCEKDCRYIMARLSKETVLEYALHIGKTVHSNPLIAFSYIIKQIESYDNMIAHVVDATRYLTPMEFDVLSFCLIDALSDEKKERIEENGQSIRKWLKSLATFTGTLFRKYDIDMAGMLQYLVAQLSRDNVYDLLVLQELVGSMSGIKIVQDTTDLQIASLSGGKLLRREGMMLESVAFTSKSTARLVDYLVSTKLTIHLGILIAKQKDLIFAQKKELKVLAWLHDHVLKSVLQYLEMLVFNLDPKILADSIPSMTELVNDFGVDFALAWTIYRPKIVYQIAQERGDLDENSMDVDTIKTDYQPSKAFIELTSEVESLHLNGIIPTKLLALFWQLSIFDIMVPVDVYETEISKRQQILSNLETSQNGNVTNVISIQSIAAAQKSVQQLQSEYQLQMKNYILVMQRIAVEKNTWFENESVANDADSYIIRFLESCIFPRCMTSPADALYCARFLKMLHDQGISHLPSLRIYNIIFAANNMHAIIFSMTEMESKNYSLFFVNCLLLLTPWSNDQRLFEQEALAVNCLGFRKNDESEMYCFDEFKIIMENWHVSLLNCFISCLSSNEYVQIRNAITILNKITEYFPVKAAHHSAILAIVMKLELNETRDDLKLMARAYKANLTHQKIGNKSSHKVKASTLAAVIATGNDIQEIEVGEIASTNASPYKPAKHGSVVPKREVRPFLERLDGKFPRDLKDDAKRSYPDFRGLSRTTEANRITKNHSENSIVIPDESSRDFNNRDSRPVRRSDFQKDVDDRYKSRKVEANESRYSDVRSKDSPKYSRNMNELDDIAKRPFDKSSKVSNSIETPDMIKLKQSVIASKRVKDTVSNIISGNTPSKVATTERIGPSKKTEAKTTPVLVTFGNNVQPTTAILPREKVTGIKASSEQLKSKSDIPAKSLNSRDFSLISGSKTGPKPASVIPKLKASSKPSEIDNTIPKESPRVASVDLISDKPKNDLVYVKGSIETNRAQTNNLIANSARTIIQYDEKMKSSANSKIDIAIVPSLLNGEAESSVSSKIPVSQSIRPVVPPAYESPFIGLAKPQKPTYIPLRKPAEAFKITQESSKSNAASPRKDTNTGSNGFNDYRIHSAVTQDNVASKIALTRSLSTRNDFRKSGPFDRDDKNSENKLLPQVSNSREFRNSAPFYNEDKRDSIARSRRSVSPRYDSHGVSANSSRKDISHNISRVGDEKKEYYQKDARYRDYDSKNGKTNDFRKNDSRDESYKGREQYSYDSRQPYYNDQHSEAYRKNDRNNNLYKSKETHLASHDESPETRKRSLTHERSVTNGSPKRFKINRQY